MNTVLRDEWGFRGMVISDYAGSYGFMISDSALRNGNDLMLGCGSYDSNKLSKKSATLALAMRQAAKNILYTVANSGYYAGEQPVDSVNRMDELFRAVNTTAIIVLAALEVLLTLWQILGRRRASTKRPSTTC